MTTCMSCQRLDERDRGQAALWDNIYRGKYWDVAHAYNSSYLGWLVLVLRRHAEAIAELSADEAQELGGLLRRVSLALTRELGCKKTYVMQFAESAEHPHVHFHVVARMHEQAPEDRAYRILRHLGAPPQQRRGEEELNQLARGIRATLVALE